jgi:hypothetical protein
MVTKWTLCLWTGETSKNSVALMHAAGYLQYAIYGICSVTYMFAIKRTQVTADEHTSAYDNCIVCIFTPKELRLTFCENIGE